MPAYEEDLSEFARYDAQVLGLSTDTIPSIKAWAKSLGKMAEEARVRVRSNRRAALDEAKKLKVAGGIGEDDERHLEQEIQKLTDRFTKSIDDHLKHKETEIMKV